MLFVSNNHSGPTLAAHISFFSPVGSGSCLWPKNLCIFSQSISVVTSQYLDLCTFFGSLNLYSNYVLDAQSICHCPVLYLKNCKSKHIGSQKLCLAISFNKKKINTFIQLIRVQFKLSEGHLRFGSVTRECESFRHDESGRMRSDNLRPVIEC